MEKQLIVHKFVEGNCQASETAFEKTYQQLSEWLSFISKEQLFEISKITSILYLKYDEIMTSVNDALRKTIEIEDDDGSYFISIDSDNLYMFSTEILELILKNDEIDLKLNFDDIKYFNNFYLMDLKHVTDGNTILKDSCNLYFNENIMNYIIKDAEDAIINDVENNIDSELSNLINTLKYQMSNMDKDDTEYIQGLINELELVSKERESGSISDKHLITITKIYDVLKDLTDLKTEGEE